MKRSVITPGNYQAVADWYANNGQIPSFARFGHALMGRIIRPNVTEDTGAGRRISALLDMNTRLVLVANHPTRKDPNTLAATPAVYEPLAPVQGNTKIMAAAKLFTKPGAIGFAQYKSMTAVGAFPVINTELFPGLSEEQYQATRDIVTRFAQGQLARGWNLALHPEGDRYRDGDPRTVRSIKPGLEHILGGLPSSVLTAVVPLGIFHPDDGPPRVHAGMPQLASTYQDLQVELREQLQAAVNVASRG
jgi:hypothetical protein